MPLLTRNLPLVESVGVSPADYVVTPPIPSQGQIIQAQAAAQRANILPGDYSMSVNIAQGVIAGIEAKLFAKDKEDGALLIGALVLLSSAVPPSGVFGYFGANEKLWEILIATFIGGAILKGVYGRSYIHQAARMFLYDTSSMAVTDEIYSLFILGGVNAQYRAYRLAYPEANLMNRAFLG